MRNRDRKKQGNRRRQQTVRRRARKEIRDWEESKTVERGKQEVVVATWNVRTLAVKGKIGLGHANSPSMLAPKAMLGILITSLLAIQTDDSHAT